MAEAATLSGRNGGAQPGERAARGRAEWAGGGGALAVEGLSHSFGKRKALDEVELRDRARQLHRAARPERRRQDHAVQPDHPALQQPQRQHPDLGTDVRARPSRALAALGVVFQQRTIDLDLTVMQNLRYAAGLQGLPRAARAAARRGRARALRAERARRRQGPRAVRRPAAPGRDRRALFTGRSSAARRADRRPRHRLAPGDPRARARASAPGAARRAVGDPSDRRGGAEDQVIVLPSGPHPGARRRRRICAEAKAATCAARSPSSPRRRHERGPGPR